jgi:hypothetical protein
MIALSLVGALIIAFANETFCQQLNENHHNNRFTSEVKSPRSLWPHIFRAGYTAFRNDLKKGKQPKIRD